MLPHEKEIHHYILIDKKVEPCDDHLLWATWMQVYDKECIVKQTDVSEGVHVSTVFLGLDHRLSIHSDLTLPILFETMVFGGEHHDYQRRYCTYEEAEAGHEETIAMLFDIHAKPYNNDND